MDNGKSWDAALAGQGCVRALVRRAFADETAVLNGLARANAFWDLHKFFDSVRPGPLVEGALREGYPSVDLAIGLQVHLAPRVLVAGGSCGHAVVIDTSILAGCAQSVPFTRGLLYGPLASTIRAEPAVEPTIFVDDVAQSVSGSPMRVVDCAVGAAPCLNAVDDSGFQIDEAEVIYWGTCPECVAAKAQ